MSGVNTAIVIVNWNGWEDTVRCIAACGHLEGFEGAVLVVDNGSTDGSFDQLVAWCRGEFDVPSTSSDTQIAALEQRPAIPLNLVVAGEAMKVAERIRCDGLVSRGLYIVRSEDNRGFGGGNNVGLRLAILDPGCQLFWLLNSDAIPESDALKALESVCLPISQPFVFGSVLLNYNEPLTVQALGSSVSFLTLKTTHLLANAALNVLDSYDAVQPIGAPIGAAMMINRSYIERFGMFDERMFLYYEEQDFVSRLPDRKSFVCTRSRVYHKGGQSGNKWVSVAARSVKADYEFLKSRAILARKIGGLTAWMSLWATVFSLGRRLAVGRIDLAKSALLAFVDGWRCVSK